MKEAYAGGGEYIEFTDNEIQNQRAYDEEQYTQDFEGAIEVAETSVGAGENLIHEIVEIAGPWPVLAMIGFGALFLLKKRVKKWVQEWVK